MHRHSGNDSVIALKTDWMIAAMADEDKHQMTAEDFAARPEQAEIRKRSVLIAGHRTSISLETAFWGALGEIADKRGVSINRLITQIDRNRAGNLSSAIRLFVLAELRRRVTE